LGGRKVEEKVERGKGGVGKLGVTVKMYLHLISTKNDREE
jgi:MinD superfamily P-loop ATPase